MGHRRHLAASAGSLRPGSAEEPSRAAARRNNGGLAVLSGVVGVLGYVEGLENAAYPAKLTDLWEANGTHDQA